jgi:vacuolar-type H+-ATPase subunit H
MATQEDIIKQFKKQYPTDKDFVNKFKNEVHKDLDNLAYKFNEKYEGDVDDYEEEFADYVLSEDWESYDETCDAIWNEMEKIYSELNIDENEVDEEQCFEALIEELDLTDMLIGESDKIISDYKQDYAEHVEESEYEAKHPYESRGLKPSDFY